MVNIRLVLEVTEYHADVYYNSKTGERIHAQFPAGVTDEVKDSKLNISKGMVSKLCREFAEKTESERKKNFAGLLPAPVMHTDLTAARINGKSAYVCVCASPDGQTLYFVREKKGHDSVKGTPVEDFYNFSKQYYLGNVGKNYFQPEYWLYTLFIDVELSCRY